jgi:nucleoside-diphosphate-sugar epimerase
VTAHPVVAVVGASGFVGSAVVRALVAGGGTPVAVPAPRLRTAARDADALGREAAILAQDGEDGLGLDGLAGSDVVVIAAGVPDATGSDTDQLVGAHALLPAVVFAAARRAGVRRVVHVSSAAVQGAAELLDETADRAPESPYAVSKALGEEVLDRLAASAGVELVIYRPPSVQGPGRRVTERVASLARSPLRSVAGDGSSPSPQALVENVGSAVARLCTLPLVPRYVIHPWEGITTGSLLELIGGGRRPRRIPAVLARVAVRIARATLGRSPGGEGTVRRIEVLWFGQRQAPSWLTTQGWTPPVGAEGWQQLARPTTRRRTSS